MEKGCQPQPIDATRLIALVGRDVTGGRSIPGYQPVSFIRIPGARALRSRAVAAADTPRDVQNEGKTPVFRRAGDHLPLGGQPADGIGKLGLIPGTGRLFRRFPRRDGLLSRR